MEKRTLFSFGVTTGTIASPYNTTLVIDNGGNLKFSVVTGGTITSTLHLGDVASIQYKGQEMLASYSLTSRYSHYEQGLGSITNISYTVDNTNGWILITCNDSAEASGGVIQYYAVRKNDDNIYMASLPTDVNNGPGEGRFIAYLSKSVFTNIEPYSDISQNVGAVEGSDVFYNADGTTASKFYNTREMMTNIYHGVTGTNVGAWMFMGNREHSSGGPFFKDIDFQTTTAATEMYNCLFTGHTQTEPYRQGLQGPYAMQFTNGSTPTTPDYSWMANLNLQGWIPASQRGTLTGVETGVASGHAPTIGLANSAAQYWTSPDSNGNYTISGIQPGTYTETLYQDQLEIGTKQVTITAANTTTANISSEWNASNTIWSIGSWDGTPLGFLNSDLIQIMHPTDVRMNPWPATTTYTIGTSTPYQWPMIQAQAVNNNSRIVFTLTAAQAASSLTLRIGDTFAFAGGRPYIVVNAGTGTSWTSATPPAPPNLNSRGITRGTWRGYNLLYTYSIPAGKLVAGANTIDIYVASGSSGTGFLSPNIVYDAIDLVANQPPTVAVAASASPAPVTGTTTNLSVLGADDSREANLVYTWTATGPAAVAYSANGTNAAKYTIATFSAAGNYTFTATIKDPSGSTITSNTTVTVTQTPSGFGISPAPANVLPGGTLQLLAGTVDQFGTVMNPASNTSWSITSGPGTLSPTGLFLAPNTPGTTTAVQVNAPGNLTSTSTINVASASAWYTADLSNGTTLVDSSGNNLNGTLTGTYSYTTGVAVNALTLGGGYASLPTGVVSSLSDFTISTWINISSVVNWARVFDFGTGTSAYMFLTPDAGTTNALRFAITTSGGTGEQRLDGPAISPNTWTHVAITLAGTVGTLYVNGLAVATNPNISLHPSSLGNTTLNYLGKSQFSDPALTGSIDDFRIFPLALSAQQVLELAAPSIIAPALAASNITSTSTANLSVTATDVTAGEPALTYTWSAVGSPPAPVTFTNNGTNAGKNTTATFTKAGNYSLRVSIVNPVANITTTSTMTIAVFPGDANQDGHIDLSDLSIVLNNFGSTSSNWSSGNFDGNPTIDLTDLSYVLNNFGTSLSAATATTATAATATGSALSTPPADTASPTSAALSQTTTATTDLSSSPSTTPTQSPTTDTVALDVGSTTPSSSEPVNAPPAILPDPIPSTAKPDAKPKPTPARVSRKPVPHKSITPPAHHTSRGHH
ncbi:MAG TPA: rhamnogalacturonan lyase B N-terminal domain-containing protein [Phycisphaerae bacterium]|nr:rhamnogalacturonan lyase B N-terminal domain-containing protein [Phycisphaerae bacterium]